MQMTCAIKNGSDCVGASAFREGTFTKIIFDQIGENECPRFAAMTWTKRDAFLAKPKNAAV